MLAGHSLKAGPSEVLIFSLDVHRTFTFHFPSMGRNTKHHNLFSQADFED